MSATILVVAEAAGGNLRPVSLELVAAGRQIANATGGSVTGLLMGANLAAAAVQLASAGVDRVLVADDPGLAGLTSLPMTSVLAKVVTDVSPFAVLVPSTTAGIEYAPRVAARLGLAIVTDAVALSVDGGSLVATRPVLGGRVLSNVTLPAGKPVVVTVRQGSFEKGASAAAAVSSESISVELSSDDARVTVVSVAEKEASGVGLDTADVIVGGGRGLKEAANFALVEQLAGALGGAVAATRAVTDAGWRPHSEQIGQTGKVVSPKLYVAVGISGAAQHVTGLQGAENIVAINRDPDAPIFKIAGFGIVGDLFEVVPAIINELKA